MKRIVFLCSGGGGNLRFLNAAIHKGFASGMEISGVLTDRSCGALTYAIEAGIFNKVFSYNKYNRSDLYDALKNLDSDVIITNIHKILDDAIVDDFSGRLINLHYSLLPSFGGSIGEQPVKDAIEAGCKFVGATTHYVERKVDSGKIIGQVAVPVDPNARFPETMNTVFRAGCLLLLNSLYLLDHQADAGHRGNTTIGESCGFFSPALSFDAERQNHDIWKEIE